MKFARIPYYLSNPTIAAERILNAIGSRVRMFFRRHSVARSMEAVPTDRLPLLYLDVGAAGGIPELVVYASRIGAIDLALLDIDQNVWPTDRTRGKMEVLSYALSDHDGDATVNLTENPGLTSLLPPNTNVVSRYPVAKFFSIKSEATIPVNRADTLIALGKFKAPHFVKLDVQGHEKAVLDGFGKFLDDVLAIEMEVALEPLYVGQEPLFEIREYLKKRGFLLRELKSQGLYGTELLEFNAFFCHRDADRMIISLWESIVGLSPRIESVTGNKI